MRQDIELWLAHRIEGLRSPRGMRRLLFATALAVAACATANLPHPPPAPPPPLSMVARAQAFQLDAPDPASLGPDLKLWATHYHTPVISPAPDTISAAMALIGTNGREISPKLRQKDWCRAALEGTVSIVEANGEATAYAFVDSKGPEQANCDSMLGSLSDGIKLATRKARFTKVSYPYGCGIRSIPLMPFRTIAVDPDFIPVGSVIYVPQLRGRLFNLQGRSWAHDGYLYAGDRGGAIVGQHIDVFHGNADDSPFEDLFTSTQSGRFEAHIVKAAEPNASALSEEQSGKCEAIKSN